MFRHEREEAARSGVSKLRVWAVGRVPQERMEDIPDRGRQVAAGLGFDYVAGRSCSLPVRGEFLGIAQAEDENAATHFHLGQAGKHFKSVLARHADIEDHQIGIESLGLGNRVKAIFGFPDHFPLQGGCAK